MGVGAPIGGRDAIGHALAGPARPGGGADAQRSELVEGEDPVGEALHDVLDAVEFGIGLGVG